MTPRRCATVLFAFGLAVMASGLYRYLSAEGGHKGLLFGIVMGGAAWGAALAVKCSRAALGVSLGLFSALTVGGWFTYEALLKKGLSEAEPRQLIILGTVPVVLVALALGARSARPGPSA